MKKYIFTLFALLLPCFVLISCGKDEPDNPESSESTSGSSINGTVTIASVTVDPNMIANVSGRWYKVVVKTTVPSSNVIGINLYYGKDRQNVSTPLGISSLHESSHTFNVKLPRNSTLFLQAKVHTYDGSINSSIKMVKVN